MLNTSKPTVLIVSVLAIIFAGVLLINSCKTLKLSSDTAIIDNPKDPSPLGRIDHFIPSDTINQYKSDFAIENKILQERFPNINIPGAEAFNKRSIISLLQAPGCLGIRIYHGVKKGRKNELRLILVGVDKDGKDILIGKGSILAAKITDTNGGLEHGQCSDCQQ